MDSKANGTLQHLDVGVQDEIVSGFVCLKG